MTDVDALQSRRQLFGGLSLLALLPVSGCRARSATRPVRKGSANATDDKGPEIARMLANGASLHLPEGVTLLTDDWILRSGEPFIPAENATISGSGPSSILRIRRVAHPSFGGLSISNAGVTFRDLTLEIDVNGGAWCAAVALTGRAANLRFERVVFRGVGSRTGAIGVTCFFADFDGIDFKDCHFENLDFGFVKAGHDPSAQRDISATGCTATRCTEVFEFNSPGLLDGEVVRGRRLVSGIATGTGRLRVGMGITSPALPPGTAVASIESASVITVTNPATRGGIRRFSLGEIRGIDVRGLRVSHLTQWAVGLANCHDFNVEVYGEDCDLDLLHIEDHSSNGRAIVGGARCNLKRGQVGAPEGLNAAVLVITGSHNIRIDLDDLDLTQNPGGMPNGVYIGNGVAGTTNTDDACRNIVVGGRLRARPGCVPVIAQHTEVVLDGLVVVSNDGAFPDEDVKLLSATRRGSVMRRRVSDL